jgi:hypothetical protein
MIHLKKIGLVIIAFVAIVIIAGCINPTQDNSGISPTPNNNPDTDKLIELSGYGSQVTNIFKLNAGMAVFHINSTSTNTTNVQLLDTDGNPVSFDNILSINGSYNGDRISGISTTGYGKLSVTADSSWNITIKQVEDMPVEDIPYSEKGTGDHLLNPVDLSNGTVSISISHTGQYEIFVGLFDINGNLIDILDKSADNSISVSKASKTIGIPDTGQYVLMVLTNSLDYEEWQVDISENSGTVA